MPYIFSAILSKSPLVCVYGVNLRKDQRFPEDRLCDFMFFDSIFHNGENMFLSNTTETFDYFLDQIKDYRETGVGVSFSAQ